MPVREVIRMGHPTLRVKTTPFTKEEILSKETQDLIEDMFETMDDYDGIGLAAPQIDVPRQLAIVGVPVDSDRYPDAPESEQFVIINPVVTVIDETPQGFWEGCLSVPGLRGFVERPRKVKIEYLDEEANEQVIEVENFLATVFQHELDHLDGILYIDRISDTKKLSYNEEFDKFLAPNDEDEDEENDE